LNISRRKSNTNMVVPNGKKISNPVKKAFLNLFVNEVFFDFFFST